jgi:hypothetical protein
MVAEHGDARPRDVALVAGVGIIGFVVGWQHPRFMTCADFAVAGASEPEGCAR